jgi:alpha-tubulin suppressor-like RCC1 family protein
MRRSMPRRYNKEGDIGLGVARRRGRNRACWPALVLLLTLSMPALAQQEIQATNSVDAGVTTNESAAYAVADVGANYRVWQQAVPLFTNESGQVTYLTNSYRELATGMNFLSNGQWVASTEDIQITPEGGAATNGQHQVNFAANINAANAVQITTPDGLQLNTHIMGLTYYDSATGSNVLFAELQDTTGQLVTNNQVVYPNAFTDSDADVRYTYTRAGLEQDIVVQQQLPAPATYGLNPDTTWLQVWTEFTDPPTPGIEPILDGADERLDFGIMKMERGKAFVMGNESNSVPVNKAWTTVAGRTFLVEQVQFGAVASQLQNLPAYSGGGGGSNGAGTQQIRFQGFPKKLPPAPTLAKRTNERLKLAGTRAPEKGLVLDYALVNGSVTNLTFQGDTTYFITGNVYLYLTTTIEGGTVVKFTNYNGSQNLNVYGPVNCQTSPYHMAVFTAMDDNTVGQTISNSTGIPSGFYASEAINDEYTNTITLQYLRISYAVYGCEFNTPTTNWLKHSQFIKDANATWVSGGTLNLQNVLYDHANNEALMAVNATVNAINLTFDDANFVFDNVYGSTLHLTNSLLVATSAGSSYAGSNNFTNSSESVFTNVGAGAHYLVDGTYRGQGTTNIDTNLLADLRNMTTYPPTVLTNNFSGPTNLAPTTNVLRDNSGTLDVGYHYVPLDYCWSGLTDNYALTLSNGVAIGFYGSSGLTGSYSVVSQGSPLSFNHLVLYPEVQEQATTNWATRQTANSLFGGTVTSMQLSFTDLSLAGVGSETLCSNNAAGDISIWNSQLWAVNYQPSAGTSPVTLGFTNNIFQRCTLEFSTCCDPYPVSFFNNLFWGGTLMFGLNTNSYDFYQGVSVADNLFVSNSFSYTSYLGYGPRDISYNGYYQTTQRHGSDPGSPYGPAITGGDVAISNLDFQPGQLGTYYYPTTGTNLSQLINAGGTNAGALGLYHYTVTTNQVPDAKSTVSIGYHYVALDTNGLPLDSNNDGIPDYLEDSNGNGRYDVGIDLGDWNWPAATMVVAWGYDDSDQSDVPPGLTNVLAVAGGDYFSVALKVNGTVVAWGDGTQGQTNVPPGLTNVMSIAAGGYHVLALLQNGTVVAWGANGHNQTNVPAGLTNVVAIAAGAACSMAVRNDGSVVAWGYDYYAQTNVPSMGPVSQVAAGLVQGNALLADTTVTQWGNFDGASYGWSTEPSGLSNIIFIADGAYHTLAVNTNGTVTAWGAGNTYPAYESAGQSMVPMGLSNVVQVAGGDYFSMALQSAGTVVAWGDDEYGEADVPDGLTGVLAISAGGYHALAIRSAPFTPLIFEEPISEILLAGSTAGFSVTADGTNDTYQWQFDGTNISGATNATLDVTNVQSINVGTYAVIISNGAGSITSSNATLNLVTAPVIITTSPTAPSTNTITNTFLLSVYATALDTNEFPIYYQWQHSGTNLPGATNASYSIIPAWTPWWQTNPVDGNYTVSITNLVGSTNSGTWTIHYVSIPIPGMAVAWGENNNGECDYPTNLTNVSAIAAGGFHSLVAKDDGTVVAWGDNANGQTNVPSTLSNAVAVAAGSLHSLALSANGGVVAWGDNSQNQTNVPGIVTNATAISAGGWHSLALLQNSTVIQWGLTNGAIPSGLSNVTAIASGTNFDLALLQNSTVVAWGNNTLNQTNVPSGLSNVVAIAAGGSHALALLQNGTVVPWGSSTNVPAGLSNVMAIAAGDNHSLALKNDGTVVTWGDNSEGQTNVPITLNNVKLIAAGGNHSVASVFSPWVQYPVNVTNDLLLIYNTNSADSKTVKDYYLQNRPMVSNANVLAINFTNSANYESISPSDFTNVIIAPITNWLALNPVKRPQYVILFLDLPSRVDTNTQFENYGTGQFNSVSYQLATTVVGWQPFVMHINMGASNTVNHTNDCINYIAKVATFGSNYSPGQLVISAGSDGYGNTNYYVDDGNTLYPSDQVGLAGANAVIQNGASTNSVIYFDNPDNGTLVGHITNGFNLAGYFCWGGHSALGPFYAISNYVRWSGNSSWYIVRTVESYNGRWHDSNMGNFIEWYSSNSFGGTNYSNTPVGAVSTVEEPFTTVPNIDSVYFGLWQARKTFAICAWNSRNTRFFQAVGDPFVCK